MFLNTECEVSASLSSMGKSITKLSHTDIKAELANSQLFHGVDLLFIVVPSKGLNPYYTNVLFYLI